MAPIALRKCSREECPPKNISAETMWHCFVCKEPIHLRCYELEKTPADIFVIDNIVMVCDECLANPIESPDRKRKQPKAANPFQSTLDASGSTLSLSKIASVVSTPKKDNPLKSVIESLVRKVENQTNTIVGLQASIESLNETVKEQTTVVGESSKFSGESLSSIKESLAEMKSINQESQKRSYAEVAKGAKQAFRGAPNLDRTPKTSRSERKANLDKPVITTGTSTNVIGKPVSPYRPKRIVRPKPEKAVWISGIHRDVTEDELSQYISESIKIASNDFEVRKLVRKGVDISEYTFVSFRIACKLSNFDTLMNPMYWPSNSRIREFDLERGASAGTKLTQFPNPNGSVSNSGTDQSKNEGPSTTVQMQK